MGVPPRGPASEPTSSIYNTYTSEPTGRIRSAGPRYLWPLAALCLTLLGCGSAQETAAEGATPIPSGSAVRPRVVSLSPLATRLVVALEAEGLLVGVDEESGRIEGLEGLPSTDLASAHALSPDLVLVATAPAEGDADAAALSAAGSAIFEFAPHDLEDVIESCRTLGPRLVGDARARTFEYRMSRPLAEIGGESFGQARPRLLAVVGFEPVVFAGGHSFETDLIEIAGGRSVTHGGQEPRLELLPGAWESLAPDVVLVMTPRAPSAAQRRAIREALPGDVRVEWFAVAAEGFWLDETADTARRLRAFIAPIARELDASR